ncbi:class I SAM-dependent methyltransferase [Patulibacter defluvii]|uniref:class I SAM-dependent methyltransferase n=1 Tax=Patulibacter defluvii TaxID=3095358 RepID=UPI002A747C23|nr:class I SAM-dependent methyltransferase [Patulibacter sp. DM4]
MNGSAADSRDDAFALLADQVWQMSYGERLAIEGLLSALSPSLAVEIGTAEGASLRRIAAHSAEVHSFDLVQPQLELPPHVHLHSGDSHQLLPEVLAGFATEGRNVDFVLVDGDHSAEGVRRDVEDLLASPAISRTIIVTHDTGNERVRAGLDAVAYGAWPKVAHVDLDLVPGHLGRERFPGELWYGLGVIVVDARRGAYGQPDPVQRDRYHGGELLALARDVLSAGGPPPPALVAANARVAELEATVAGLRGEVEHHRALWQALMASPSWRATAPLRLAKRLVARRRSPAEDA